MVDQKLDRNKYRSLWKEIYGRLRHPADIIIVDWEKPMGAKNTVGAYLITPVEREWIFER